MKLSLSIALTSVSVTRAVLGPGYEDYLWCPAGDCEIYINPFGYMGPVSMYNKCFDTTTGTFSNGVWTGDKTNVTAPEGWTQPPKCTAAEYSQCDTAAECSLQVGPGCSCYVSSTVFPFDASNFRDDATCTGNECDGHEAECSAGPDGEGNTCMIKFALVATPPATTVTTGTGATTLPVTGDNGTVVVTTATTAATTVGGAIIEDKETTITTTSSTAAAGGGPVPTPAPSSGNVASVSISLFVVSAAVFGYFS